VSNSILYFAYDASLEPDRISSVSPGAVFRFTAHYPETRLDFFDPGDGRPRPTLVRDPAHTVWGGVFEVPEADVDRLVDALSDGRATDFDHKAVDREGNKHDCLTFVGPTGPYDHVPPDPDYVTGIIRGASHWQLPAGWVLGLEDLIEDPLLG
jgi:hypothetical protein